MKSIWFIFGIAYLFPSLLHQTVMASVKKRMLREVHIRPNKEPKMGHEGHLTCPTFGDNGCQLICEIFCDFYGCVSRGQCSNSTCYCFETFLISYNEVTPQQFSTIPVSLLWRHKFGNSDNSTAILRILQKSGDIWEHIEPVLRNPSQTAISIKSHMLSIHPDWSFIHHLKPMKQGYVDDFIRDHVNKYDDEHIEHYNDMVMDYVAEKYYYSLKGDRIKPHCAMGRPETHKDTKYFYKLIQLCQNAWLMRHIEGFVKRKGYTNTDLKSLLDPKGAKKIAEKGFLSLLIISSIDWILTFEKKYDKDKIQGSKKHTFYYLLSKRQIDELNDFDFDDFEEEMANMQQQTAPKWM